MHEQFRHTPCLSQQAP